MAGDKHQLADWFHINFWPRVSSSSWVLSYTPPCPTLLLWLRNSLSHYQGWFFLFSLQISNTSSHFSFFSQWSCLFNEKRESQERNDTFIHLHLYLYILYLPCCQKGMKRVCGWLRPLLCWVLESVPLHFSWTLRPVFHGFPPVNHSISIWTCCSTALKH